jgi:hypothetical protein
VTFAAAADDADAHDDKLDTKKLLGSIMAHDYKHDKQELVFDMIEDTYGESATIGGSEFPSTPDDEEDVDGVCLMKSDFFTTLGVLLLNTKEGACTHP